MSYCVLHLEPEAEPKADEEGQVGWQEPGVGARWEGQVHLASDTGANWPGDGPWTFLPSRPPCLPWRWPAPSNVGESAWTGLRLQPLTLLPHLHARLLSFTDPSS